MAPAACDAFTTAAISAFTASWSPDFNAPTFITMSTSCAPSRTAMAASAAFASVLVAPSGKPATLQTFTADPDSSARTSGTQ